ncbi:MAG: hypothetical protein ACKVOL_05935 [Novosphingobium sp.]
MSGPHAAGLKVYMDLEFQYVSDDHPWLKRARHDPALTMRDWLYWNEDPAKRAAAAKRGRTAHRFSEAPQIKAATQLEALVLSAVPSRYRRRT